MKQNISRTVLRIAVCAVMAAALLTGCQNMTGSSEAQLLSFVFEQSRNTWLGNDITGKINESAKTVTVTVPEEAYQHTAGKNKKFKASFTVSPKAKLYKGKREQTSGELEDLFIADKEYTVVAENGTKVTYTVCIKIEYKKPVVAPECAEDAKEIEQFYGTYRGKLNFDSKYKTYAVFDKERVIIYSGPMSSLYTNMEWTKEADGNWVCRTYHKDNFERKRTIKQDGETIVGVRATATFTVGAGGSIRCSMIVNAMENAPSDAMQKGADYVFNPDDGEGFKAPSKL